MDRLMVSFRVLVVEDNEGDLILIEDYLRDGLTNPEIDVARSFRKAIDHYGYSRAEFLTMGLLDIRPVKRIV
jgi:hypothetical protein